MLESVSVLCGQLLVVGLEGTSLTEPERASLAAGERGGVVLFRRNIPRGAPREGGPDAPAPGGHLAVAELTRSVAAASPAGLPPLVAVDQEGGRVMRLGPPAMQLPPMRRAGDLDDPALLRRVALAQGRELSALGFTMSFAPVVDVHTRDENPIIGDRAFATTAEQVARLAGAFAEGLTAAGVLTCAKHFPGHGDTTVDSHLALPRVDRPRDILERVEIAPFRALARSPALASMMTAHVVYDALDAEQPATLSRAVCHDLLRRELCFEGVLFSDDLEMKAIQVPVGEAAVRAVLAGCDVLLVCSSAALASEAHAALVHEAEKSASFRARCEDAAGRAIAMRRRAPPSPVAGEADLARAFAASRDVTAELARRLAEAPS